jgi:hypothetical protein
MFRRNIERSKLCGLEEEVSSSLCMTPQCPNGYWGMIFPLAVSFSMHLRLINQTGIE